jgi:hypothetical protein
LSLRDNARVASDGVDETNVSPVPCMGAYSGDAATRLPPIAKLLAAYRIIAG